MAAALVLRQDVNLALELGVGVDGLGLRQNLAALNAIAVDAAEQDADVVTSLSEVQQLVEHLDARHDGLLSLVGQADNLNFLAELQLAALHTASRDGAAAGDGEHVLDRHEEGQGVVAGRSGNIVVNGIHQLLDAGILGSGGIAGIRHQGVQGGTLDDGQIVAGELVGAQQLADFHLHQLQQLLVVHLVALVQEDNDGGHAHLAGQQDVLTGLRHGTVGGGDNQDRAVHLRGARDHVLDIVGVARAVNVGIMTLFRLIFHVGGVDRDTTGLFLGSLVNAVISLELSLALEGQPLGDGGGQSGLAVVNMADGANVDMGFGSLKFLLSHLIILL